MDALPVQEKTELSFASRKDGIMHACGHDVHTSVLLGTAKVLSSKREDFSGTVKFVFQPAEENMAGAKLMLEHGILSDPTVDAIIGLHCWPEIQAGTVGFRRGSMMAASDSLKITVEGKQGHAAHPDKCIDPIAMSAQIITALQTIVSRELSPVEAAVISLGQIHGGNAPNIIPEKVEISGTVRTINPVTRKSMPERIGRLAEGITRDMRGRARVEYGFGCPPLISDDGLLDTFEKTMDRLLGFNSVVHLENPSMGSEDFAYYLEKVPGMFFRLGTADYGTPVTDFIPLHSPYFKIDEKCIVCGITAMCGMAVEYLSR
jgi:amidohydrolase